MMIQACSSLALEEEARGLRVQGHLQLQSEVDTGLGDLRLFFHYNLTWDFLLYSVITINE